MKTTAGEVRWDGVGRGLKLVLLPRNPALNSDAALSYKYMFGPHRVLYLICESSQLNTYNQKYCVETKQKAQWRFKARTQETHKQDHDEPDHRH